MQPLRPRNETQPHSPGNCVNREKTAAYLERLTAARLEAINRRDWTYSKTPDAREALLHTAKDFGAYWDNHPQGLTHAENVAESRKLAERWPNYHLEIQHISSDVDEAKGEACVYTQFLVEGLASASWQGFSEMKWRQDQGEKWWSYRYTGMRSTSASSGFV